MTRIATSLMMMVMLTLGLAACGHNTPRLSVGSSVSKAVTLPSLPSIMKRSNKTKQETVAPTNNSTVNPEDHGLTLSETPAPAIQYQPTVLAKNNATNPYLPPYEEQPTPIKLPSTAATIASPTEKPSNNTPRAVTSVTPTQTVPTAETSSPSSAQPPANNQTKTVQPASPANNVTAPSQAKAVNAINQNDVPAMEASQSLFTPQKEMAAPSAGITKAPIVTSAQTVNSPASKTVNNNAAPATIQPTQAAQPTKSASTAAVSKPTQSQSKGTMPSATDVTSKSVSEKPMLPQTAVTTTPAISSVNPSVKKSSSAPSAAVNAAPEHAKPAVNLPKPEAAAVTSKPAAPVVNSPKLEVATVASPPTKATTAPNNASTQKSVMLPEPPKPAPPAPGSLNRPDVQPSNEPSNQALPSPTTPSDYHRPSYQRFNEPTNEALPPAKPKRPAPSSFDQVPVPVLN